MEKRTLNEYSVARGHSKKEVWYFNSRFFKVDGVQFEIVQTQTVGDDTVHTVVRTGAKRRKIRKHKRLFRLGIEFKKRSHMRVERLAELFKEGRLHG